MDRQGPVGLRPQQGLGHKVCFWVYSIAHGRNRVLSRDGGKPSSARTRPEPRLVPIPISLVPSGIPDDDAFQHPVLAGGDSSTAEGAEERRGFALLTGLLCLPLLTSASSASSAILTFYLVPTVPRGNAARAAPAVRLSLTSLRLTYGRCSPS